MLCKKHKATVFLYLSCLDEMMTSRSGTNSRTANKTPHSIYTGSPRPSLNMSLKYCSTRSADVAL